MNSHQQRLWDTIQIGPEKWTQIPYGVDGSGFWAIALIGRIVVWYNDIEDGFNCSRYTHYGKIDSYYCNQDELEHTIEQLMNLVKTGNHEGSFLRPPEQVSALQP